MKVEELERSRKEATAAANRGISFSEVMGIEEDRKGGDKKDNLLDKHASFNMSATDSKVAVTLSGLRLHLDKAASVEFLSALTQKELEEVNELLAGATAEFNAFVVSELGILRKQHAKALAPM
jgi:hypothetical protein